MNPKRAKRFEELKQQAIITLYELDMLTGDGSIIHDRNTYRGYIVRRIRRLEKKGEDGRYDNCSFPPYTLDGLEQRLKEANIWITKIKLRGR